MQTPNGKPLSGKRLVTMFALITLLAVISIGASYAMVYPCQTTTPGTYWSPPATCPTCCGCKLDDYNNVVFGCPGGTSHTFDCVTVQVTDSTSCGCGTCSPVTGTCTSINWMASTNAVFWTAGVQQDPNCE